MRKKIVVIILVLLVSSMTVVMAEAGKKKVCCHQVEKFMADYYHDYNLYAQDAGTIDLMDKYWAPEFIHISYLPVPEYPVFDLTAWKYFLVGVHLNFIETLTVDEMSIDIKNLTVVTRATIEFHERATGNLVLHLDGIGFYNLKVDENNKLKMTFLKLYTSNPEALMALSGPPPGM